MRACKSARPTDVPTYWITTPIILGQNCLNQERPVHLFSRTHTCWSVKQAAESGVKILLLQLQIFRGHSPSMQQMTNARRVCDSPTVCFIHNKKDCLYDANRSFKNEPLWESWSFNTQDAKLCLQNYINHGQAITQLIFIAAFVTYLVRPQTVILLGN